MKFFQFATHGALGALAIALTVGALPASARPGADDANESGEQADTPTMTESRGAAFAHARQQRDEAQQAQQQARQQQQVQQQAERQLWQGRQQAQVQQQQAQQQQARQQEQLQQAQRQQWQDRRHDDQREQWQGQRQADAQQWQGQQQRNRTYTDRNRSTTYGGYDRNGATYGYQNSPYGYQNQYRDRDNLRWDRGWRNNSRYDWQRYRTSNRNTFNLGIYYSPYRNYSYRRIGIGSILQQLFYGNNYWINNPYQYRLPEVYGPYRWVRYYDDALLVDLYSGQVVDVLYDFFW